MPEEQIKILVADDYVTKPFHPRELMARVKAVLRRARKDTASRQVLQYGNLQIDLDQYIAYKDQQPVPLTRKELELLWLLAGKPNRVFSREQLLEQIWDYTYTGDTRTVDTHIKRLRRKLEPGEGWEIKTVWAVGYKFEVSKH